MGVRQKGDFNKITNYLKRVQKPINPDILKKYGEEGVAALASATPVRTGKTAASWSYEIKNQNGVVSIVFKNSNIVDQTPIAIILQYGHATKGGGWVEGRDYINPAIRPIFEKIVDKAWKEVIK